MPIFGKMFKKEELPEEIRDLEPAQIVERLKAAELAATRAKELETEVTTTKDQFTQAQSELQQTKTRLQELEVSSRNQNPGANGNQNPAQLTSFLANEDQAFAERAAPILAVALESNARVARIEVEASNRPVFNKWGKEIDDIMSKESPQRRADPNVWRSAVIYVKGLHSSDIEEAARRGENIFFSEPATSGQPPKETKPVDKLTKEEEEVCRKMRVDPKKYLEQRNKMQVVA